MSFRSKATGGKYISGPKFLWYFVFVFFVVVAAIYLIVVPSVAKYMLQGYSSAGSNETSFEIHMLEVKPNPNGFFMNLSAKIPKLWAFGTLTLHETNLFVDVGESVKVSLTTSKLHFILSQATTMLLRSNVTLKILSPIKLQRIFLRGHLHYSFCGIRMIPVWFEREIEMSSSSSMVKPKVKVSLLETGVAFNVFVPSPFPFKLHVPEISLQIGKSDASIQKFKAEKNFDFFAKFNLDINDLIQGPNLCELRMSLDDNKIEWIPKLLNAIPKSTSSQKGISARIYSSYSAAILDVSFDKSLPFDIDLSNFYASMKLEGKVEWINFVVKPDQSMLRAVFDFSKTKEGRDNFASFLSEESTTGFWLKEIKLGGNYIQDVFIDKKSFDKNGQIESFGKKHVIIDPSSGSVALEMRNQFDFLPFDLELYLKSKLYLSIGKVTSPLEIKIGIKNGVLGVIAQFPLKKISFLEKMMGFYESMSTEASIMLTDLTIDDINFFKSSRLTLNQSKNVEKRSIEPTLQYINPDFQSSVWNLEAGINLGIENITIEVKHSTYNLTCDSKVVAKLSFVASFEKNLVLIATLDSLQSRSKSCSLFALENSNKFRLDVHKEITNSGKSDIDLVSKLQNLSFIQIKKGVQVEAAFQIPKVIKSSLLKVDFAIFASRTRLLDVLSQLLFCSETQTLKITTKLIYHFNPSDINAIIDNPESEIIFAGLTIEDIYYFSRYSLFKSKVKNLQSMFESKGNALVVDTMPMEQKPGISVLVDAGKLIKANIDVPFSLQVFLKSDYEIPVGIIKGNIFCQDFAGVKFEAWVPEGTEMIDLNKNYKLVFKKFRLFETTFVELFETKSGKSDLLQRLKIEPLHNAYNITISHAFQNIVFRSAQFPNINLSVYNDSPFIDMRFKASAINSTIDFNCFLSFAKTKAKNNIKNNMTFHVKFNRFGSLLLNQRLVYVFDPTSMLPLLKSGNSPSKNLFTNLTVNYESKTMDFKFIIDKKLAKVQEIDFGQFEILLRINQVTVLHVRLKKSTLPEIVVGVKFLDHNDAQIETKKLIYNIFVRYILENEVSINFLSNHQIIKTIYIETSTIIRVLYPDPTAYTPFFPWLFNKLFNSGITPNYVSASILTDSDLVNVKILAPLEEFWYAILLELEEVYFKAFFRHGSEEIGLHFEIEPYKSQLYIKIRADNLPTSSKSIAHFVKQFLDYSLESQDLVGVEKFILGKKRKIYTFAKSGYVNELGLILQAGYIWEGVCNAINDFSKNDTGSDKIAFNHTFDFDLNVGLIKLNIFVNDYDIHDVSILVTKKKSIEIKITKTMYFYQLFNALYNLKSSLELSRYEHLEKLKITFDQQNLEGVELYLPKKCK